MPELQQLSLSCHADAHTELAVWANHTWHYRHHVALVHNHGRALVQLDERHVRSGRVGRIGSVDLVEKLVERVDHATIVLVAQGVNLVLHVPHRFSVRLRGETNAQLSPKVAETPD